MHLAASVLPQLLLPVGLTLILAAAGLLFRRRWLVVVALALLWTASTPLASRALMRAVEGEQVRAPASAAPAADAVVVLSGARMVAPGPAGITELGSSLRFMAGMELVLARAAPRLVFTGGWSPRAPDAPLEGDVALEHAVMLGLPREQVLTTGRVVNTAEEAVAVAALLREVVGVAEPHALLVTSAFHMPRADALFERQGVRVTPFPVDFRADRTRGVSLVDLVPRAGALAVTETALREVYGRVVYRVGW